MSKRRTNGRVYVHDGHIDIDILIEDLPFDCNKGDKLLCLVKDRTKLGNKIDGYAHIVIAKVLEKSKPSLRDIAVEEHNERMSDKNLATESMRTGLPKSVWKIVEDILWEREIEQMGCVKEVKACIKEDEQLTEEELVAKLKTCPSKGNTNGKRYWGWC